MHQNSEILPALGMNLFCLQCPSVQFSLHCLWETSFLCKPGKAQINSCIESCAYNHLFLKSWKFGEQTVVKDEPAWQGQVVCEEKIVACVKVIRLH